MFAVCLPFRSQWAIQYGFSRSVRKHKTTGPQGTRRLWRPVLCRLSYGPGMLLLK
jgi:hypothetical protein